jgi:hypothetical protein
VEDDEKRVDCVLGILASTTSSFCVYDTLVRKNEGRFKRFKHARQSKLITGYLNEEYCFSNPQHFLEKGLTPGFYSKRKKHPSLVHNSV